MQQPFSATNLVDLKGFVTGGHVIVAEDDKAVMVFDWTQVDEETLISIVRHRLAAYQGSPTACDETASADAHLQTAMWYLESRRQRRITEGVSGTYELDAKAHVVAEEREAQVEQVAAKVTISIDCPHDCCSKPMATHDHVLSPLNCPQCKEARKQ